MAFGEPERRLNGVLTGPGNDVANDAWNVLWMVPEVALNAQPTGAVKRALNNAWYGAWSASETALFTGIGWPLNDVLNACKEACNNAFNTLYIYVYYSPKDPRSPVTKSCAQRQTMPSIGDDAKMASLTAFWLEVTPNDIFDWSDAKWHLETTLVMASRMTPEWRHWNA